MKGESWANRSLEGNSHLKKEKNLVGGHDTALHMFGKNKCEASTFVLTPAKLGILDMPLACSPSPDILYK